MDTTVLVVAVVFISIVWVIERTVSRIALSRERLRIIEKGGDLKDLKSGLPKKSFADYNSLKYGLVAIGLSIGSLIGSFLEQKNVLANNEVGYVFSVALFVGIGLIISHYLIKKEDKRTQAE